MERLSVLIAVAGAVFVVDSEPAAACSCLASGVRERVERSDVAFVGVGDSLDEPSGLGAFRVLEPVRGVDRQETVHIAIAQPAPSPKPEPNVSAPTPRPVEEFEPSGGGACLRQLPLGEAIAITASRGSDGRLISNICDAVGLADLRDYREINRLTTPASALVVAVTAAALIVARRFRDATRRAAQPSKIRR